MDGVQAALRNTLFQKLLGIGAGDAHVGETLGLDPAQQRAHARAMHLNAEVIVLRMRGGHGGERLAVAEANFDMQRRVPAEERNEVELRLTRRDAVARQQFFQRALLRIGDAPFAAHEAADRAMRFGR